jgi:hypothetical protein
VDLWSIARYDLGLSLEEFEDIDPGMFYALCKRKSIRFKYERLAHAITASAVYNANRQSSDSPIISPMDFIREVDPVEEQTKEIKKLIKEVVGSLPAGSPAEKYQEIRSRTIASLESQGRTDAETLFNECWPSLAPKE